MRHCMETINWNMVTAITSIMSIVMAGIGTIIVFITKWIFITKKEATLLVGRKEYEKETKKIWTEIKSIETDLVRRPEWEKSKAYRERRSDETQRIVCGKIDRVYEALDKLGNHQTKNTGILNNLLGRFDIYLELQQTKEITNGS